MEKRRKSRGPNKVFFPFSPSFIFFFLFLNSLKVAYTKEKKGERERMKKLVVSSLLLFPSKFQERFKLSLSLSSNEDKRSLFHPCGSFRFSSQFLFSFSASLFYSLSLSLSLSSRSITDVGQRKKKMWGSKGSEREREGGKVTAREAAGPLEKGESKKEE